MEDDEPWLGPYQGPSRTDVDATTLDGKVLCGYQGWFNTPGDGTKFGFRHWGQGLERPNGGRFTVDMWPDLSEYDAGDLHEVPGVSLPDGSPARLYSAYRKGPVLLHTKWMRQYGIDGVFLSRFVVEAADPAVSRHVNRVLASLREGCHREGRVWALMLDLSMGRRGTTDMVKDDWRFLCDRVRVLEDGRYMRHHGRPVVLLWGLGFKDRPWSPEQAVELIEFFQKDPVYGGAYLIGGVDPRWRTLRGESRNNGITDMDALPFVTPVYKRDLVIEKYFNGYLKHPYLSFYTGRGCKSRCTFCLWPQTVGGHKYRTRSIGHVIEEVRWAQQAFPQVKELFFDDDTLTDDLPRVEALARELGKLGIEWCCNAKGNVPRATLKVMRDNGLRLLTVGYESGNQKILHNIKKGMLVEVARQFTKDCHDLGITIHGTFILGLPGETKETIEETIRFATEMNPHTIQVSLAAPYPGTFLYKQAVENEWFAFDESGEAQFFNQPAYVAATVEHPAFNVEYGKSLGRTSFEYTKNVVLRAGQAVRP